MAESGAELVVGPIQEQLQLPYKLNLLISFIAGMGSGVSSVIVGYPFDNIRVRLQTINDETGESEYKDAWDCLTKTIKKEGFLGLYKGASATFAGLVPVWTVLLFTYDVFIKYLYKWWPIKTPFYNTGHYAVSGLVAGTAMCVIMTPQELIRNLLAIQRTKKEKKYDGFFDCLVKIYQRDGILGFYKGNLITLIRDIPGSAFYYLGFETMHDCVLLHKLRSHRWTEFISNATGGMSAGVWFWMWALPFDTWKNRVQVEEGDVNEFQVLKDLVQQEGVVGLYRGIIPTYIRGLPVNCMVFVSNFYVKKALGLLALYYRKTPSPQQVADSIRSLTNEHINVNINRKIRPVNNNNNKNTK